MSFEEILGQERVIRALKRALTANSLPHAYLFYGSEGLGKFKTALALAKALLCENREGDFCGSCFVCKRVAKESHPDVIVIRPESRRGNKEWTVDPELGAIRIEQVREFQRWISVRSFEGGWKVGIFDGADKMNPSSSNALLKTLEEPPAKTLLILISPTRSQLLPTVVSRCQPAHFSPVHQEDMEAFLSEQQEIPKEGRSLVSALSGGSPGKALRMDSKWVIQERREWVERLKLFLVSGPQGSLTVFADDLNQSDRLLDVLDLYESWYRDLLVCRIGTPDLIINKDFIEEIAEASERQDPGETISKIDSIRQARRNIQSTFHLNKRLVMEDLLLELSEVEGWTGSV